MPFALGISLPHRVLGSRMPRRRISLALDVSLVLLGALLGLATNYATSRAGELPLAFRLLQRWSLPLVGVTLLLILVGRVWLYLVERPPSPRRMWNSRRPPYPGLEAFTEEDAGVFFGREREINHLLDRLHPTLPEQAHRFVAVIGPSGVGKSSLVQAGLLPRLAQRRSRWVVVPPLVPEDQPTRNLARSLAAILPGRKPDALAADLDATPAALGRCAEELRAAHGGRSVPVLLVVDQLEELLTRTGRQERTRFLSLLRQGLHDDPGLWVVATLRSEFLTVVLNGSFADLFQDPVVVGSLGRAALVEVIEGPAAQAGLTFAPGVVNSLVSETGGGDALPLLAYTLQALYLRAGPGGTITGDDYRQLGGVAGTLARQADKVAAELANGSGDHLVLETLLHFVALGETEPTRRRMHRNALSDTERRVVDAFVAARLLTSDAAGADAVVEVAHEALFRQWAPLREAIQAHTDDLRQRADLERWAQDWVRSGRQDAYLLPDERLRVAQRWAAARGDVAPEFPLVAEFLDRSRQLNRATSERLSEAVASRALTAVQSDPEQSLLLALAAVEECAPTALAHRALLAALAAARVRKVLRGHAEPVRGVAWSPDGTRIATASYDGTARIWDAERGTELAILRGHEDMVRAVAWASDGQRIATVSRDRTARVWDAEAATELAVLQGHEDWVQGLAWSPDSQRIVTASADRTARVWDAEAATELAVLQGHENWVEGVTWSPDGQRIVTASADRTVRLWDAERGNEVAVLGTHDDWVESVAWSSGGERIVTGSRDRTARVWDVAAATQVAVLRGHEDWVQSVAWSPDGRRIATASSDRTARLWDAEAGTELAVLRGHEDGARGVAWSPDGERIATVSYDRTGRIWDAEVGTGLAVLRGHPDRVQGVAWSPDGRRIATASSDRTARVWDPRAGIELTTLHGHLDVVVDVAWSPDGRRIATASGDRTIRVWDAETGAAVAVIRAHSDWIQGVAWSPDGRRIATGSEDRSVRIWDAVTGTELAVLRNHGAAVNDVAWSADGEQIATASRDRTARLWDIETGTELAVLRAHSNSVQSVAWSPDGQRIATASSDRTARVWAVANGTELAIFRGHEDGLQDVAWSPDGQRIVTASHDRTARVWDADRGTELAVLGVHEDWVERVAWSPDGQRIATASRDRTARVWDARTDLNALLAKAHDRTLRQLTAEERRSAMLPEYNEPLVEL